MKRIIKVIGILLVSAFILLPLKTNAQESEWIQKLELGDSVSSAIAKVEDGVVVMQYEGTASKSNFLIKYDFDGKKVWEIPNIYGYNIESVSDGFVVWSDENITKFDKDHNIIWNNSVELKRPTSISNDYELGWDVSVGLGNKLIELNNIYIIIQTQAVSNPHNDIFKFSLSGELIERIPSDNMFQKHILLGDYRIIGAGSSTDKNSFFIIYDKGSTSSGEVYITNYNEEFSPVQFYTYNVPPIDYPLNAMDWTNGVIKVIETDDKYLAAGRTTISFLKDNTFKVYKRMILDMEYIDNYFYAYEIIDSPEHNNLAQAAIVKYSTDMKRLKKINLPFYLQNNAKDIFKTFYYSSSSGFSQIKNRIVLNLNSKETISAITLNTPIKYMYHECYENQITTRDLNGSEPYQTDLNSYSISSFKLKAIEESEKNNASTNDNIVSGIINNITKNPQTDSIITIIVFIIIISVVSVTSSIIYKKVSTKKQIRKGNRNEKD